MPAHKDTFGRFYIHPQLQADGSYKDVLFVEIGIKGNKNTSFSRPANDQDKQDWPKAWNAFRQENVPPEDGTSLRSLGVGPSEVMNLNAFNIRTVEDLAELNEAAMLDIPGSRTLQKRARAYLAAMEIEQEEVPNPGDPLEGMDQDTVVKKEPKKRGRKKAA